MEGGLINPLALIRAGAAKGVTSTGMERNAVLISEEVWRGIQDTLDLVSIPGMRESILDGMGTPLQQLSSELRW